MKTLAATIVILVASSTFANAQNFAVNLGNGIQFGMQGGQPQIVVGHSGGFSQVPPTQFVPTRPSVPTYVSV